MDYGLGTSIVNGLKEGLIGYQTMRNIRNQEEQMKRQQEAQGLLQGIQQNAQTGRMEFTPEMQRQRTIEAQIRERQAGQYDPLSRSSTQARELFGGLLGPKTQIPQEMTAAELKEFSPALIAGMKGQESDLDKAYKAAKIGYLKGGGAGQSQTLKFSDVSNLRKEFNTRPEVKDFRDVGIAFDKVKSAANNPTAAGDLSLIFGYMKMLDPGSTVREGEFANAQNAAGVPDQIRNLYEKVRTGTRLNPDQRKDFVGQAESVFNAQKKAFDSAKKEYSDIAEIYGIPVERLFGKELINKEPDLKQKPANQISPPATNQQSGLLKSSYSSSPMGGRKYSWEL